ncbi:type II toxin-antitoxin system HicA family toxin [Halomonas sp. NO4]|uniref:type II toxin-antitoxin system HicA family toxin n=1 Tax=Halomonas sp. NO4 TaxID=2484813 RepID=UPI0013D0D5CC|nr:type II toxin-antitoxin system HicA family toxin [Halomonas sp. NO4]
MSEPTELSPDHKPIGPASSAKHRGKRGAGKGGRKALYGLLAVSLVGAVVSGALLLRPAPDEVAAESLVQSQVQRAVVPLEEVLARVESQQATLEQRLTDLDQRLELAEQRVKESAAGIAAKQAQLEQLEPRLAGLAEELSRLDSELNLRVTAQNEQIQTLSERLEQNQRQQAAPRPAPASQAPRSAAPPSPPFQVTGVESRGGHPYVGVSPNGLSSLRDIRLLGVGDRQDGWELSAIRGSHVVFRHNGHSVDVQIP